jgi:plastocyanin
MIALGRHLAMLACLVSATGAQAAKLSAMVYGGDAKPLANAVVVAVPEDGRLPPVGKSVEVVDQIDKEFVPYVKAVRAGSYVRFPNKDNIVHHVYSFSPARTFELPLYKGTPSQPVLFDKPGVVKLGCNIHDWMVGYIVVLDTPYFVKTATDGKAHLDVPAGTYQLQVWHPQMVGAASEETVVLTDGESLVRAAHLSLLPEPPRSAEDRMREFMKKKSRKSHPYH